MIDVLTEELRAPITDETAELYVGGTVFKTGPPALVGVELEWLGHDTDRPDAPVHPERLAQALAEESTRRWRARSAPNLAGSWSSARRPPRSPAAPATSSSTPAVLKAGR